MLLATEVPVWAQILLECPVSGSKDNPVRKDEGSDAQATKSCLVLLAHGSKDPRWREPFEKLFCKAAKDSERVRLAYMEFTGPTLLEVAEECARENVESFRVLPLFMAAGAHLATDVPEQLGQVSERHPRMRIEVLPPIGEDRRVAALLEELIREKL